MNDTPRPTTLREVAQLASQRHGGKRGRGLARAAEGLGYKTTHTTLDNVLQGRYSSRPSDLTLRILAALAGMEEGEVFELAERPPPVGPLVLPEGSDALSIEQREAIVLVVRQFAEANEALHGREDVMGNAEHPAATIAWAATVVIWVDQIVHQVGRPIPAELRRARNILAHSQLDEVDPEFVMSAFKLAQTELEVVLAELTATLDPPTGSRLGSVIGQGDLDEALDEQPPEDEDPATIRGGIEADWAARGPADT